MRSIVAADRAPSRERLILYSHTDQHVRCRELSIYRKWRRSPSRFPSDEPGTFGTLISLVKQIIDYERSTLNYMRSSVEI